MVRQNIIGMALPCFLTVLGWPHDLFAQQEDVPKPVTSEYKTCHETLWSEPMTTYKKVVRSGQASLLRSGGTLGDNLREMRCSEDQLKEYMTFHSMRYISTEDRPRIERNSRGKYNRRIYYCDMRPKFLYSVFWRKMQRRRHFLYA